VVAASQGIQGDRDIIRRICKEELANRGETGKEKYRSESSLDTKSRSRSSSTGGRIGRETESDVLDADGKGPVSEAGLQLGDALGALGEALSHQQQRDRHPATLAVLPEPG